MSSVLGWLSAVLTALLIFVIGQAVAIYYGERFKNWTAQRSIEDMNKRIVNLKQDIEEARELAESLTPLTRALLFLIYILCVFLPATVLAILVSLVILFADLLFQQFLDMSSFSEVAYAISTLMIVGSLLLFIWVWWRAFQNKKFEGILRLFKNGLYFTEFEEKANQTISHLEGRVGRMTK